VTLLLEINTELLQEICSLQGQGKSGHIGPMPPPKDDGKEEVKAASKEYIEYVGSFHPISRFNIEEITPPKLPPPLPLTYLVHSFRRIQD
jgi:hypothetical protein